MRLEPSAARIAVSATIALVATAGFPGTSHAQQASAPLAVGTRIRVTTPVLGTAPQVATVLALRGDTLAIRPQGTSDSVALAATNIAALDVSVGSHTRVLKGMGVGFLIGVATGAVAGALSYRKCEGDCAFIVPDSRGFAAFAGGVAGAVIGPLVGAAVGAVWRSEDWTPVSPGSWRSSVQLRMAPAGSPGVGLSVMF
jgi:hypothetical protein